MSDLKRFLVFAYDGYYPSGGLNDVAETFDNPGEAVEWAKTCGPREFKSVWDRVDDKLIWSNDQ